MSFIPQRSLKDYQQEWAAWYSADTSRLINYYGTNGISAISGRFWGNLNQDEFVNAVHMPLAQDICSMSAALLFSEAPTITISDGNARVQDRMQDFINETNFESTLNEAADLCAGMGGVYLKIDTDSEISRFPIITTRDPLTTKPTFKGGKLVKCEFMRAVKEEDGKTVNLVEIREHSGNGYVVRYEMREIKGSEVLTLDYEKVKADYEIEYEDAFVPNVQGIGVVYIPNLMPNRLFTNSNEGTPDYQGSVGLLDSLDEVWSSWIRDIELGMSRLLIDQDMLKSHEPGATDTRKRFDPHNRAFLKLSMDEWRISGTANKPIESIQFNIRADDHLKTTTELINQIIARSGYAAQSFGINVSGSSESGASLRIRERKSMITRNKKERYWQSAIQDLLTQMQQVDNSLLLAQSNGGSYTPEVPNVSISDSVSDDMRELSETVRNLSQANAASTFVKVSMMHPDWSEEQIIEEVDKINTETGLQPVAPELIE